MIRKLRKTAAGAKIRAFRALRPRVTHPQHPAEVEEAAGHSIRAIERRGKHIVVRLDGGLSLDVHLKMSGNLTVIPDARMHSDRVRALFTLADGRGLVLEDRRLLGYVHLFTDEQLEEKLAGIGVDPLSRAFTPSFLADAAKPSKKPVKIFLMDQKPVAGLGNIYSAESLFRARIHPAKPTGRLSPAKITKLHTAIREVLKEAIPAAVKSYRDPGAHDGMRFRVYDREGQPCVVCGRAIRRITQAGRSTYFCPFCQR